MEQQNIINLKPNELINMEDGQKTEKDYSLLVQGLARITVGVAMMLAFVTRPPTGNHPLPTPHHVQRQERLYTALFGRDGLADTNNDKHYSPEEIYRAKEAMGLFEDHDWSHPLTRSNIALLPEPCQNPTPKRGCVDTSHLERAIGEYKTN